MILGTSSNFIKHNLESGDPKLHLRTKEDDLDMIGGSRYLGVPIESQLKSAKNKQVLP